MDWIIRFVKGSIVGIGAILPGLSGGVLAVIFGIYDPIIRFLGNLRKDFVKNFKYFLPVALGLGAGIILFSVVVSKAFGKYEAQFVCLFIGFVLGTFPSLYRTAGMKGRSTKHIVIMLVTAVILFGILFMGGTVLTNVTPNFLVWLLCGGLVGLGFIVPGLSSSNFLIYLGLYDKMADGIKNFDFAVIIPLVIGAAVCILLFARLMTFLLDRYHAGVYHFILGTVIGSSLVIFPIVVFPAFSEAGLAASGLTFGGSLIFCLVLLIIGILISWRFSKFEEKVERNPNPTV